MKGNSTANHRLLATLTSNEILPMHRILQRILRIHIHALIQPIPLCWVRGPAEGTLSQIEMHQFMDEHIFLIVGQEVTLALKHVVNDAWAELGRRARRRYLIGEKLLAYENVLFASKPHAEVAFTLTKHVRVITETITRASLWCDTDELGGLGLENVRPHAACGP